MLSPVMKTRLLSLSALGFACALPLLRADQFSFGYDFGDGNSFSVTCDGTLNADGTVTNLSNVSLVVDGDSGLLAPIAMQGDWANGATLSYGGVLSNDPSKINLVLSNSDLTQPYAHEEYTLTMGLGHTSLEVLSWDGSGLMFTTFGPTNPGALTLTDLTTATPSANTLDVFTVDSVPASLDPTPDSAWTVALLGLGCLTLCGLRRRAA